MIVIELGPKLPICYEGEGLGSEGWEVEFEGLRRDLRVQGSGFRVHGCKSRRSPKWGDVRVEEVVRQRCDLK